VLRTDAAYSLVDPCPPKYIPSNIHRLYDNFNGAVEQDRSLLFWNMKNNLCRSAWIKEMKMGVLEVS
jgi:hypothetical protein